MEILELQILEHFKLRLNTDIFLIIFKISSSMLLDINMEHNINHRSEQLTYSCRLPTLWKYAYR
jgi:hypothetical protein